MTGPIPLYGGRRVPFKSKLIRLFKLTDAREKMVFEYTTQFIRANCAAEQYEQYIFSTCNISFEEESLKRLFNCSFIEVARLGNKQVSDSFQALL